jgi:hypothetical protein
MVMNGQLYAANVLLEGKSHGFPFERRKDGTQYSFGLWKNDGSQSPAQNLMPSP